MNQQIWNSAHYSTIVTTDRIMGMTAELKPKALNTETDTLNPRRHSRGGAYISVEAKPSLSGSSHQAKYVPAREGLAC